MTPLRVHIVVESGSLPEKKSAMVEARIRADPSLPEVVLTSHLQEEKFSANDNQSGVANMLEIGRALTRLIADGKLPRPRRGIRLWWCDEIRSEYRYFADHPGEEKKVLANLNQDMVGAKQSVGGRVQRRTELEKAARMIRDSVTLSASDTDGSVWNAGPSETERRLEKSVPKKAAATLADWLALQRSVTDKRADEARRRREERDAAKPERGKVAATPAAPQPEEKRLTPLMQWEAMNWVDGKTDAAAIARRVCAEALSAGSWYYGDCTPEMVEKFFDTQAKDGLISW